MRKKVALSIAAAAMVGTLAVGGTLAWFTDTETATNVVTVGSVDIKLSERGEGDGLTDPDGLKYTDVMPGREYQKVAIVENEGNNAFVRAKLTVSSTDEKVIDEFVKTGGIEITGIEGELTWSEAENGLSATTTLNYDGVFETGAEWIVFEGFAIPSSWGNSFAGADFNIKIDVEAIQSDNLSEDEAWNEFGEVDSPDKGGDADITGDINGGVSAL